MERGVRGDNVEDADDLGAGGRFGLVDLLIHRVHGTNNRLTFTTHVRPEYQSIAHHSQILAGVLDGTDIDEIEPSIQVLVDHCLHQAELGTSQRVAIVEPCHYLPLHF